MFLDNKFMFSLTFCAKVHIIFASTKYLMINLCIIKQISFKIFSTTYLGLLFDNTNR